MARFDVIVPAYNAAHFLPMALDSVIAQTYTDWRILLIDDGSVDGTPALAATYKERLGDKLLYIRQENRGLSAARNTAIRHAAAEFLCLLDADDEWLPCRLAETLKAFEREPEAGLAYGFVDRIDLEGRIIDRFTTRNKHAEGFIAPYIYMRSIDLPCPTTTFRRSAVEEVGGFDETMRSSEDRDLWLRIALRYKVILVPVIIAHYRVSPAAMTTDSERMLRAQLQFLDKNYGAQGCGWRARRVALGNMYRQRAETFAGRGQAEAAFKNALRALGSNPLSMRTLRTAASLVLRGLTGKLPSAAAAKVG